jgi:hypothetical protein
MLAQQLCSDDRARFELVQLAQVHDAVDLAGQADGHGALALAAQLGQSAVERRLAALEAGANRVARVLALLAARRGLAVPASDATPDALLLLARAGVRLQVGEC